LWWDGRGVFGAVFGCVMATRDCMEHVAVAGEFELGRRELGLDVTLTLAWSGVCRSRRRTPHIVRRTHACELVILCPDI